MILVNIAPITLYWTQKYCKVTIPLSWTTALAYFHHLDLWTNFHQGILLILLQTKVTKSIISPDLVELVTNNYNSFDLLGWTSRWKWCRCMASHILSISHLKCFDICNKGQVLLFMLLMWQLLSMLLLLQSTGLRRICTGSRTSLWIDSMGTWSISQRSTRRLWNDCCSISRGQTHSNWYRRRIIRILNVWSKILLYCNQYKLSIR